ncbi:type II secretion system protein GspM [Zoogloea sp.]|uniref:type II secretion system protein GspM n=1 Tax=Zoogloea sp. TaxID=49181 RepID=UPI0032209283
MSLIRHRAVIAVGVTFVVIAAVVALAAGYAWERYLAAQAVIDEIEPRYARLLGLQGADAPLKKSTLDAYADLRRWVYPAEQDSGKAGNDVQQRARRVAETAGMNIVSSQVLPVRVENGVEQIPASLTLEGSLQGLQMTLAALSGDAPVLFVDSLSLRAIDRGDPKQPQLVSATMVVMSLRIQP